MPPRKSKDIVIPASCASCKHWCGVAINGRGTEPEAGECHRYPPVYVAGVDDWQTPITDADFLCGEHLMKPHS